MTKDVGTDICQIMPNYMNVDYKAYTAFSEITSNDCNRDSQELYMLYQLNDNKKKFFEKLNSLFKDLDKAANIQGVIGERGEIITDQKGMDEELLKAFQKLYTTSEQTVWGDKFVPPNYKFIDGVKILTAI